MIEHVISTTKSGQSVIFRHSCHHIHHAIFSGQYFGATIIMVSLSCSMTVVVLHIHHSGANGKEVPQWLKTLTLDYLARVFCMDTDLYDKETLVSGDYN